MHSISSGKVLIYYYNILLLMENLPTINQLYTTIRQQSCLGVIRKYESGKQPKPMAKSITKKKGFLDDQIKLKTSPGPANKSNLQPVWAKKRAISPRHSSRKTFIEEIQYFSKKKNQPSPSQYSLTMPWPLKNRKDHLESQKTNFINTSEYASNKSPGPGNYIVATIIGNKKMKKYKFVENKPRQETIQPRPNMTTYDPVNYDTFKRIQKMPKVKSNGDIKIDKRKPEKENKHPGPGQYQIVQTWLGKQALKKGQLHYMDKIHKGPFQSVYQN